ncbi:MAG: hypothetical protein MUF71_12410 [Candidatus Kapabacteria bacterium]|jgi:hypothetical protein|nr:hypothetical protein [Candidatus Kapabacteria bacterium]
MKRFASQRFTSRFWLCVIFFAAQSFAIYAQNSSAPQVRSDEEDFKKFLPPNEVINWGVGVYGGIRGTVNTTFRTLNPTYTPTFSFASEAGLTVDIFPQADFGLTLYAPMLFAEKIGLNLDVGLSTYSFGTQMWSRFILSDTARDRYLNYVNTLPDVNGNPLTRSRREVAKFQTTVQFINIAPMLNIGGFLLGLNIGVPLSGMTTPFDTSALRVNTAQQAIDAENLQLLIEPRVGLQIPLFSIKNVGTFFLTANASYNLPIFDSPMKFGAMQPVNQLTEAAIRALPLGFTDASFRYPVPTMPGRPNIDANRTRFDTISVRPFSASVGLSFVLNFTNKTEQEEFLQEERKADSLRITATKLRGQQEYLRNKSINLADSAINTIIVSAKISDRLAQAEQAVLEQQKKVLKTELTETKKKVFQAQIVSISGTREDGTEVENPTVRVEQFAATAQRALLPMVYFDQGSAIPPSSRYRRIQSAERENYKLPSDVNASATSVYQHLLNIIGKRMAASSAKLTITGQQTRDEADTKLAEKRAEAIATYFMDVWKIPANRLQRTTKPADASNQADKRSVEFASDNAETLAPLTIDYTTRLASPPVVNFGIDINTGAGLKQWELEFQQIVDNQPVTIKEAKGGDPYPQRYEWRLNDEPATMPQSAEPVTVRIGAYDINNAAAPDAVLRSVKVEQVSLESKRKSGAADRKVSTFECLFGGSLTDMDASSKAAFEAAKRSITPQSRVSVIVSGGNASVNARAVAQALSLDARSAVLRDAATPTTAAATNTPEADAYKRLVKIRVESPVK